MSIQATNQSIINPYLLVAGAPIGAAALIYTGIRLWGSQETNQNLDQTIISIKHHMKAHPLVYGTLLSIVVLTISALVADYMGWINLSQIKKDLYPVFLNKPFNFSKITASGDNVQMNVSDGHLKIDILGGGASAEVSSTANFQAAVDHGAISFELNPNTTLLGIDGTQGHLQGQLNIQEIANTVSAPRIVEILPTTTNP